MILPWNHSFMETGATNRYISNFRLHIILKHYTDVLTIQQQAFSDTDTV